MFPVDITSSLLGGVMIGLSATVLLVTLGRVAGISGIVGSLIAGNKFGTELATRFPDGSARGGGFVMPHEVPNVGAPRIMTLVVAGLLVGIGDKNGQRLHERTWRMRNQSRVDSIASSHGYLMASAMLVAAFSRHFVLGGRP